MTTPHDHDHELVMELADNGLQPDSGEARRRLDDCSDCLDDLRLQGIALAALRSAPAVGLDELEAVRLRRDLHRTLEHRQPAPAATVAAKASSRTRSWAPLLGAAAVLFAVAVAVPTLNLLAGAGDDDADVAFSEATDTLGGGEEDTGLAPTALLELQSDAPAGGTRSSDPDTTEAFATDTPMDLVTPEDGFYGDAAVEAVAALESLRELVADTDAATAKEVVGADGFGYDDAFGDDDPCIVEGSLLIGSVVESYTLGTVTLGPDEQPVLVTVHRDPTGLTILIAHDPETCGVLQATS